MNVNKDLFINYLFNPCIENLSIQYNDLIIMYKLDILINPNTILPYLDFNFYILPETEKSIQFINQYNKLYSDQQKIINFISYLEDYDIPRNVLLPHMPSQLHEFMHRCFDDNPLFQLPKNTQKVLEIINYYLTINLIL